MILSALVATCGFLKGAAVGAIATAVLCRQGLSGTRPAAGSGWSSRFGGGR